MSSKNGCPYARGTVVDLPSGTTNYIIDRAQNSENEHLLLCCHGFMGSLSAFSYILPSLRKHGFSVLRYDLLGHGLSSSRFQSRYTLELCEKQAVELLDHLDFRDYSKISILGYSMGGLIATHLALTYRFARILLISPAGLLDSYHNLGLRCLQSRYGGALVDTASLLSQRRVFGWLVRRILSRRSSDFDPDTTRSPSTEVERQSQNNQDMFNWKLRRSVRSFLAAARSMPMFRHDGFALFQKLAQSQVEVLFLWGDADCAVPWYEAKQILFRLFSTRNPKTSVILVHAAGHAFLFEKPFCDLVANIASDWFNLSRGVKNRKFELFQQAYELWKGIEVIESRAELEYRKAKNTLGKKPVAFPLKKPKGMVSPQNHLLPPKSHPSFRYWRVLMSNWRGTEDYAHLREDGREYCQMRPVELKLEVSPRADGSCSWSSGRTTCECLVNGPMEYKRVKQEHVRTVFLQIRGDTTNSIESDVESILEKVIVQSVHPLKCYTIQIQVLRDDGSLRSTIFNSCVVALVEAGVPLNGTPYSVTTCLTQEGQLVIDPTHEEETNSLATVVCCGVFRDEKVESLEIKCHGKLRKAFWEDALAASQQGIRRLHFLIRDKFEKHFDILREVGDIALDEDL